MKFIDIVVSLTSADKNSNLPEEPCCGGTRSRRERSLETLRACRNGPAQVVSKLQRTGLKATFRLYVSLTILAAAALSACSSSQPSCSDDVTIKTLRSIIDRKHMNEGLQAAFAGARDVSYTLENIVTTEQADRKAACKATFGVVLTLKSGETKHLSAGDVVNYIVEKTDDGKILVTTLNL